MSKIQTQPQYVNLQPSAVQVYDEHRHAVTVLPWSLRQSHPNGLFVVEGVHYQQFVSGRGPLYPFPADAAAPPGPLGETPDARHARLVSEAHQRNQVEGLQAAAGRSKIRIAADVVRQGVVVGETQEAFAARLRPLLHAAGVIDADAFRKASKEQLLTVEGITEANLPRVREMGELIFGADPKPDAPAETAADYNQYSRKAIEHMSRKRLVEIVQKEFDGVSIEGTAADVRARLVDALQQHNMLID